MEERRNILYKKLVTAEDIKALNASSLITRSDLDQMLHHLNELKGKNIKRK